MALLYTLASWIYSITKNEKVWKCYRDYHAFFSYKLKYLRFRSLIIEEKIEGDEEARLRGKSFQNYNIKGRIQKLKNGLSRKCIETVDMVIKAYLELSESGTISVDHWYDYSMMKDLEKIKKEIRRIKLPSYMDREMSIDVLYYHSGLWFVPKKVIESIVDGKDILDCGAYNGDSALVFSRFYWPRRIFSFEPESANYEKLLETVEYLKAKNIVPLWMGVGDRRKKARITANLKSNSHILEMGTDGEEVDIIDIDSFVEENDVKPGLIKMDIEGYESKAIKGAIKTIKKYRPILLISIYHNPEDFFEIKPLLEKRVKGYNYLIRHLVYNHPTIETTLIAFPNEVMK